MGDPNTSDWLKSQQKASRKARWLVGCLGLLVLLGIVGGVAYAVVSKSSNPQNSVTDTGGGNGGGSNGSNGPLGGNGGNGSTGVDPNGNTVYFTWDHKPVNLTITPNPALKKSFWGINYGPVNATYPWCGNTLGDVIEDIKLLSQLTSRIRLYGMDCQMANMTIWAIKILNVNMTVVPTIWVDNNATTYKRQYDSLFTLINDHGVDKIDGVSVGNEVIFRKEIPTQDLFARIADVRQKVNTLPNVKKKVPVFTSDLGSNIDDAFVAACDLAFANVHPYFGGVPAQQGATWTFQFFQDNDVTPAAKAGKEAIISEIGWPTAGDPEKGAIASVPNLNDFLGQFLCAANTKLTKYYYFESFDTPWKTAMFTLLEGSWGLFTPDRKLKTGLTIPDCAPTAPGFKGFS
ncbi:9722_t:CDS:2 [Paraglomus brasilianum]|uniref:glucan endo-1,3-beta-D-glucosidase n=1 Tax=Paraglomus brasilianum TaxID=144538 RepID=A0A9N8ZDT0_9GLOM|nr:9722_t:CDS:2 [Paraglomus brasilianum]